MSSTTRVRSIGGGGRSNKQSGGSNKQSKQSKTLTTVVHGPKDVKAYITQVTEMATKIRANFMSEMAQSASSCNQRCPESSYDFAMEMCGVTHRTRVYHENLPQFSVFLQTESVLLARLAQLESLRKMLVNNKQQKRTAIPRLRELRNYLLQMTQHQNQEQVMELLPHPHPTVMSVQRMIESTKQSHRTISKGLIDQATKLMDAIRTRHILDLAKAADDTAGAVMEHAQKCQSFMTQCLRLSAIEYCAKIWWFGTQNPDPTNSKNYYIHAEVVYGDTVKGETPNPCDYHFKASRAAEYFAFCAENNRPMPEIYITVYGDPDPEGGNNNPLIFKYKLDQELAETILTDEAIDYFEEARRA
jgi:hypothetical protein